MAKLRVKAAVTISALFSTLSRLLLQHPPLATSALIHAVIFVSATALFFRNSNYPTDVEITVIEVPKQAPVVPTINQAPTQPKKTAKQPRAVYGLSRKALTSNQGEAIKAGNTVAKTPDEIKLKSEDADQLPIPTDEYLVTRMPELISEIRIPYPPEAKAKNIQGAVVMDILVDQTGSVHDEKLISGPGAGLNEVALNAVRGFKFKPALVQDKAVTVRIRYAYRFVLEK